MLVHATRDTLPAIGNGIAGVPDEGAAVGAASATSPKPAGGGYLAAEYKQQRERQSGQTAAFRAQLAQQQAEILALKSKMNADAAQYQAQIASLKAKIVQQRRP
jgi:hypothetical protein